MEQLPRAMRGAKQSWVREDRGVASYLNGRTEGHIYFKIF